MAIMEKHALDMSSLLMQAYDIGDLINKSAEVADYLYWKAQVEVSEEVRTLKPEFEKKKLAFQECERFGHYHPDYHAAMEQVQQLQMKLEQIDAVARFKTAESKLDELLFQVSEMIAYSVSETIKVPSNNPLPSKGGGCSSGGSCSGGCG